LRPDFVVTQDPHEYFLLIDRLNSSVPRGAEGVAKL
jgi:hypothetical protein